jgi:hypothetical protein
MAISIDWTTYIISVPKADLTLIQASPTEIRELNVNWFRLQLKAIEASLEGHPKLKTHNHNTEVLLGGIVFARTVEILEPYTITFEDGAYAVNLVGANNNIGDRINYNQVQVRPTNSAGLISNAAIEYSSFNGGVIIDVVNGRSGTVFPSGTIQQPVNNIQDALLIANYRGFNKLYIHSDITIDESVEISNFVLVGQSHVHTEVVLGADANCENITIENCDISGTLDGGTTIKNCSVGTLNYVNGEILDSGLYGTIYLSGAEEATLKGCYTIDQDTPPIIDMGGSSQDLSMPNYSGLVTIKNLTSATEEIGIGLQAGMVILDSTITAGTIIVSGVGLVQDNTTGTAVVNIDGLINKTAISDAILATNLSTYDTAGTVGSTFATVAYGKTVYYDVGSGESGTTYPFGTKTRPVNDINDVKILMGKYSLDTIYLLSDLTMPSDMVCQNGHLTGEGLHNVTVTFTTGNSFADCLFEKVVLTGDLDGSDVEIQNCRVQNLTNIAGSIKDSILVGNNTLKSGLSELLLIERCTSESGTTWSNLNVNNNRVNILNFLGLIQLGGLTSNDITAHAQMGYFYILPTCTGGSITLSGRGRWIDTSGAGCTVNTDYMYNTDIQAEKVWDELAADHTDSLTMGGKLNTASAGGVDYDALADAVWDEDLSGHTTAGTAGATFNNIEATTLRILGLSQENFRFFGHVYDGDGNLTSANIRIYPTSTDVENNTNHTDAYRVLASYTDKKLTDYQVLKI